MAGISILLVNFLLMIILASSFIGFVLFVVSIVLFVKKKKQQQGGNVKARKIAATVLLVLSFVFQIPLVISIAGIAISSGIQKAEEKKEFEALEGKVYAEKEEWKSGFDYNGKHLVPVNLLIRSDNYRSSGKNKNLEKIGALVMEGSYDNYSLYQIINNSGYDLYYVWVVSFAGGEYYSRTFVEEKDYEAVLEYYETSNLSVRVFWKSAPENTGLNYQWIKLDLQVEDKQDALMQLAHEVLDDVSDKKRTANTNKDGYDCIVFRMESEDSVFSIDFDIYTKEDVYTEEEKMMLWLNDYEVESEVVDKYKELLFSLIQDAQTELLQKASMTQTD